MGDARIVFGQSSKRNRESFILAFFLYPDDFGSILDKFHAPTLPMPISALLEFLDTKSKGLVPDSP